MRTFAALLLLSLVSVSSLAQTFRGESTLPVTDSDGFYRIALTPDLMTHLNQDFSNIRIVDSNSKEVPYFLQTENPTHYTRQFKGYTIVEKNRVKKCCTSLVLENPASQPINNISLAVKNADVSKKATLLGSDDKETWYALKEQFTLSAFNNQHETSEVRIVDFPLSNYSYYKLEIDDSTTAPLNILSAGYYEMTSEDGKFTPLPLTTKVADNTNLKSTSVTVTFDTTYVIDKLIVSMKGAPYFLRRASVLQKMERINRNHEKEFYYSTLSDFILSSKQPSTIELPATRANELVIMIENEDNPALELASVSAFQLNRYLTAWLKKGEAYRLKLGPANLQAPVYDIGYFKDSIPHQPETLTPGPAQLEKKSAAETSTTVFTSKIVIWVAIGLVIVVLGFMAVRMLNETSKAQKNS